MLFFVYYKYLLLFFSVRVLKKFRGKFKVYYNNFVNMVSMFIILFFFLIISFNFYFVNVLFWIFFDKSKIELYKEREKLKFYFL